MRKLNIYYQNESIIYHFKKQVYINVIYNDLSTEFEMLIRYRHLRNMKYEEIPNYEQMKDLSLC